jgi:hypothetical protein
MLDAAKNYTNAANNYERHRSHSPFLAEEAKLAMSEEIDRFFVALDIYVQRRIDLTLEKRR